MSARPEHPDIWFFFGLSGTGKSYATDIIAAATGWPVYHADDDITPAMRLALAQSRPFTDAMRDEYFELLVQRLHNRPQSPLPLLVSQGAYKQRSRDYLQQQVPGMALVWIDAPDALIQQRLGHRADGIKPQSAAALRQDFEPPADDCLKIVNNGGQNNILNEFRKCQQQWLTRRGQVI